MKKKLLISGVLTTTLLFGSALGAFAASNMEQIKAFLNTGVNFKVDGQSWKAVDSKGKAIYPISYNNTTYLPIRAAGEALGVEVGWDSANNTIWLGEDAAKAEGRAQSVFNVDTKITAGPMTMNVSKVTFAPSYSAYGYGEAQPAIILDIRVENTSSENLTWYVDQTELVLNTKEQIENTIVGEYYVSSDFYGKVVKTGKIVFPVKSSKFTDINELKLLVKYVTNDSFDDVANDQEVIIKLK